MLDLRPLASGGTAHARMLGSIFKTGVCRPCNPRRESLLAAVHIRTAEFNHEFGKGGIRDSGGAQLHHTRWPDEYSVSAAYKIWDMARMKKPSEGISAAIRTLRGGLGETQAGMARLLGVSLRTYDRWEAGNTIPRGNVLMKLIDLCPDDYARSLFRGAALSSTPLAGPSRVALPPQGRPNPEGRLRMRLRNSCLEAIEIIYESAVLGSLAADEKLRSYADELNRSAAILAKGLVENTRVPLSKARNDSSSADESRSSG